MIFDPLGGLTSGDENSNSERELLVRRFRRIVRMGPAVIVVPHFKKVVMEGIPKDDLIRGANALKNASPTDIRA